MYKYNEEVINTIISNFSNEENVIAVIDSSINKTCDFYKFTKNYEYGEEDKRYIKSESMKRLQFNLFDIIDFHISCVLGFIHSFSNIWYNCISIALAALYLSLWYILPTLSIECQYNPWYSIAKLKSGR